MLTKQRIWVMATANKPDKQKPLTAWDKSLLTEAKAFHESNYKRLNIIGAEILKEYTERGSDKRDSSFAFLDQLKLPEDFDYQSANDQLDYIEEKFYFTTSSEAVTLFMRRHYEGYQDERQNLSAAIETFNNRFPKWQSLALLKTFSANIPTTTAREYLPGDYNGIVKLDYSPYANTWVPPTVRASEAQVLERPTLWQDYLDRLMPKGNLCWYYNADGDRQDMEQQDYFEKWFAQRIRRPQEENTVCIVLRGDFGTGKGFWMDTLAEPLVGMTNYKSVSTKDWKGDFNGDMFQSTIIHLEETKDTRQNTGEMLKKLITQGRHRSNEKNLPQRQVNKHFAIVITSNHMSPITIEKNDRRYFVPVFSRHKLKTEDTEGLNETAHFIQRFDDWLKLENGFQTIRDFFESIDLSDIRFRTAPETDAKKEIWNETSTQESNEAQIGVWLQKKAENKFLFTSLELAKHWQISDTDAQQLLRLSNFEPMNRRIVSGENSRRFWGPKAASSIKGSLSKHGYKLWFRQYEREDTPALAVDGSEIDTSKWLPHEIDKLSQLQNGKAVITNIGKTSDPNLIKYAHQQDLYVYCGRTKDSKTWSWGNPYEIGKDDDRDEVCEKHKTTFPPEKLLRIYQLRGKVLGCYCWPQRCHCDHLAELANSIEE